jgi:hypothetical protein
MKEVPANKKKSLGKLPTPVRNKMGYMEEGGPVPKTKKKMKLNMSLEEFAKLTPEEKAAYKRQGDLPPLFADSHEQKWIHPLTSCSGSNLTTYY